MLVAHVHVTRGISRVRLAAIIQTSILLVELLRSSTIDLLTLRFTLTDLNLALVILHVHLVDQAVHKVLLLSVRITAVLLTLLIARVVRLVILGVVTTARAVLRNRAFTMAAGAATSTTLGTLWRLRRITVGVRGRILIDIELCQVWRVREV